MREADTRAVRTRAVIVAGCWAAGAGLLLAGFEWRDIVPWADQHSGSAAWVQAVGSVLAIMASAGVVYLQHALHDKRDQQARLAALVARMRTIQEIADSTAGTMLWCRDAFPTANRIRRIADGREPFPHDAVRMLPDAVASIPLHELSSPAMVFEVRVLVILTRQMQAAIWWLLANHAGLQPAELESSVTNLDALTEKAYASVARIREHVDFVEREGRVPLDVGAARSKGKLARSSYAPPARSAAAAEAAR